MTLEKVYLSLGSNIGNSFDNLKLAINKISENKKLNLLQISPVYRTEPWGNKNQDYFFNCAVEVETNINPWNLKSFFQEIETDLGKKIKEHWGERTIDIDIIFYGNKIIYEKKLIIPHPRFHLRKFVLIPLCDITTELTDPVSGQKIKTLAAETKDENKIEFYSMI